MSHPTRKQFLEKLRRRYKTAGLGHKSKRIDQAVLSLGYHRKAAIRALGQAAVVRRVSGQVVLTGRPVKYEPNLLLPWLRPIWQTSVDCETHLANPQSFHRGQGILHCDAVAASRPLNRRWRQCSGRPFAPLQVRHHTCLSSLQSLKFTWKGNNPSLRAHVSVAPLTVKVVPVHWVFDLSVQQSLDPIRENPHGPRRQYFN